MTTATAATVAAISCFSSPSSSSSSTSSSPALSWSCCPSRIHQQPRRSRMMIRIRISSTGGGEPKSIIQPFTSRRRNSSSFISCQVALKPDASSSSPVSESETQEEEKANQAKIGSRVRVKGPQLKVYHIPKVPEMDIAGMEGQIKQYVALWKGKRISANFPFKVEFFTEIQGRGPVKFLAHLREDEFEYI